VPNYESLYLITVKIHFECVCVTSCIWFRIPWTMESWIYSTHGAQKYVHVFL